MSWREDDVDCDRSRLSVIRVQLAFVFIIL